MVDLNSPQLKMLDLGSPGLVNSIDQTYGEASDAITAARLFVQQSEPIGKYLKAIRTKYLQDASKAATIGRKDDSMMLLYKADAIAAVYEHLYGVFK